AFLAALLRAQPMGFYSPQSLVADARRHGVQVRRPDIVRSGVHADLEPAGDTASGDTASGDTASGDTASGDTASGDTASGDDACLEPDQPPVGTFVADAPDDLASHRRDGSYAVRLGFAGVTSIGEELAGRIVAEREQGGAYTSMTDLTRRVSLTAPQVEALATAGAFDGFGLSRRQALWGAGHAARESPEQLTGTTVVAPPPMLPGMSEVEQTMADLWATGISPEDHPVRHVRGLLDAGGALAIEALATAEPGRRVKVGGVVTHRQRPSTAAGVTFLNLEDETGMVNVICTQGLWSRYRRIGRESKALVVRGILERHQGVVNITADKLERLPITARTTSRDFS
ncbi:MAG: OB-fold nucleic acid binding domain-containing protein, partial [Nocardioidaceae bacterium]